MTQLIQFSEVIKTSSLSVEDCNSLKEKFEPYFSLIEEWSQKADGLVITDKAQKTEIAQAKEAYKLIKQKRIDIEKTRKSLKEESLKRGQAIDQIARILNAAIAPLEETLEQKAKFVEIQEAKEKAERTALRVKEIAMYQSGVIDSTIENMDDNTYKIYLDGVIMAHNKRIEEERIEEEKRVAEQKAQSLRIKRRDELIELGLITFLSAEQKQIDLGCIGENDFQAIIMDVKVELIAHERKQEAIRIENERLKAERIEAERKEAERKQLQSTRLQKLLPYSKYTFVDLSDLSVLSNEDYENILKDAIDKDSAEKARLEEEKRIDAEKQRVIAEENARIEALRLEAERKEAERLELKKREAEEKERLSALSDEEKIKDYFNRILSVLTDEIELSSKSGKDKVLKVNQQISSILSK